MLEFPGCEARSSAIQQELSAEWEIASRMFSSWMHRPIMRWLNKSDLPSEVLFLAWALNTQACRQFRSVVELCRIGEGENASILARSLFETVLAAHFVLAPTLDIVVKPKLGRPPHRQPLPGKWTVRLRKNGERRARLSRSKRALIYLAHCKSQSVAVATTISNHQLATTGEQLTPKIDPCMLEQAKRRIGPEWRFIQGEHPNTYSGLSNKVLSDAAGDWFPSWYKLIYSDQSRQVHAVDPISFVTEDAATGEPKAAWFSHDGVIGTTLYCANMLFFCFMGTMHLNIDMCHGTEMLLQGYMEELKAMYQYSPTKP